MNTGLSGKTALITGGSQGIGKAIALSLAREGAKVGICARGADALNEAAKEISNATQSKVVIAQADCTNPQQIKDMVSLIVKHLGRIDILVNCVGRAKAAAFLDLTDEDWDQTINLKLMAAVRVTREVLPHMVRARWGRVIMIGGVFGIQPSTFSIPMGVVNAGLFNFTKALAQDVARHNILVNAVAPGRVDTPLFRQLIERQSQQFKIGHDDAMAKVLAEVPIGRAGTPTEIANVVTFLASDLASYMAGEVVTVDGSWVKCL
jgi:NAD(P)-dependent dehydrogenase (short-subunit alcohol dehydrogenase family)